MDGCRGSAGDRGQSQPPVEAQDGSRQPISLQVGGAEGGVGERGGPLDIGGLREEGVELTLGFDQRALGGVEERGEGEALQAGLTVI